MNKKQFDSVLESIVSRQVIDVVVSGGVRLTPLRDFETDRKEARGRDAARALARGAAKRTQRRIVHGSA